MNILNIHADISEGLIRLKIIPSKVTLGNELLLVNYTANKIREELGIFKPYLTLSDEDINFLLTKLEKQ